MAHNLNENGNRMFYVGEKPWHELGTRLDNPATAKEAIEAAKLDYRVECHPIFLPSGNRVDFKRATVRIDTGDALGIIGNQYQPVQNTEAFEFFDIVVGEGQAIYHTAGALGKGERIWIMAKLPGNIIVGKDDAVEKYLLLTNTHDGTTALRMYFTPIRVVCENTLIASLPRTAGQGINIRHMGDIKSKIDFARKSLGIVVDYYAQFEQVAKSLADCKLNREQVEGYFAGLVFKGDKDEEEQTPQSFNTYHELLALFEHGIGHDQPSIKHSAWAAYNAVTEYVDHSSTVRGFAKDNSRYLKNIWFGVGAKMKSEAFDNVMAFVK